MGLSKCFQRKRWVIPGWQQRQDEGDVQVLPRQRQDTLQGVRRQDGLQVRDARNQQMQCRHQIHDGRRRLGSQEPMRRHRRYSR